MDLLKVENKDLVEKTNLTRKLTLNGKTETYPVYKVRLDQLFYNDQNDRITTWITQYKNDKENIDFNDLDKEKYNSIIEKFIIDSNPEAINKTKANISLVNQREPGVVLSDGRIIDGNRRFTCLRLLHNEENSFNYFETVILDSTIENNKKQIKLLELSIQHGEEQRVGYNLIDLAIGAYHDIVETNLISIEEYAQSTNENISEVKRRLETAQLITEFLDFMNVSRQYHIAREMQVYSVFFECVPLLKRCANENEINQLKTSVFNNVMMGSFDDNRKYIRNVKSMMDSGFFSTYIKQQDRINEELSKKKEEANIHNKAELEKFVSDNSDKTEDLQISLDRVLLQTKKEQTKSKPSQIVNKSVSMLMDIDTRIIEKLSDVDKEKLKIQIGKLNDVIDLLEEEVSDENSLPSSSVEKTDIKNDENKFIGFKVAKTHIDEPYVYCTNRKKEINNLSFPLFFSAYKYFEEQTNDLNYLALFVDENFNEICQLEEFIVKVNENTKVNFELNSNASKLNKCYLVLKSKKDTYDEAQQIIEFSINMFFSAEFDF